MILFSQNDDCPQWNGVLASWRPRGGRRLGYPAGSPRHPCVVNGDLGAPVCNEACQSPEQPHCVYLSVCMAFAENSSLADRLRTLQQPSSVRVAQFLFETVIPLIDRNAWFIIEVCCCCPGGTRSRTLHTHLRLAITGASHSTLPICAG